MNIFQNSLFPSEDLPAEIAYPYDLSYFTEDEFKRCNPPCSLMDMNRQFMYGLDIARSFARVPFKIRSAFRSIKWELDHGRKGTSSHTKGLAVDIECMNDRDRWQIVWALTWQFDHPRFGFAKDYIHVEIDSEKPSAIWIY